MASKRAKVKRGRNVKSAGIELTGDALEAVNLIQRLENRPSRRNTAERLILAGYAAITTEIKGRK